MSKNFPYLFVLFIVLLSSCSREVPAPEPLSAIPTIYQLEWQDMEQYAFIHFTTNTFTGKEWGYGDEKPSVFNPTDYDPEQWVIAIKEAGLKGLVLTCKHHDGFCLWPSNYTEHSIKNSPFQDGKGDVVRDVSAACKKHGIKFGIYLSPWDRNSAVYGKPEYLTYYRNQLEELIKNYGPVFEIWFDGANGGDGYYGGARQMRRIDNATYYDWETTRLQVLTLAPASVMFSDAGPDVRWCGNERGFIGDPNWSTITNDTLYPGKAGIEDLLNHGSIDGTAWVPAEVDVSIRPGWFYHAEEDSLVKSPEKLFKIYMESVGRGANLILNLPPDRRGLLHEKDVEALKGWKKLLDEAFAVNLAAQAKVRADTYRGGSKTFASQNVCDNDPETYWTTDDAVFGGCLDLDLGQAKEVHYIVLKEYIRLGQRVKSFNIQAEENGEWKTIAEGTTIGHKRILELPKENIQKLRVNILDSKACPTISEIEVY